MVYLLRRFLILLALSVAVSPTLAKESDKSAKKSKPKSSLFSKKKTSTTTKKSKVTRSSTVGKSQYKSITVNVNRASASALSAYLVGVGPVKAKAIVDYRKRNGKFSSLKDLMEVDGIGEETFKGLKKNVSLSRGEATAPKGYKMGEVSSKSKAKKKTTTKKRSTSSSSTTKKAKSKSSSSSKNTKSSGGEATSPTKKVTSKKKKTTTKKKTKAKKSTKSKDKKQKKSKKKAKKKTKKEKSS